MATGTVKYFHPEKAYGFIIQDDGSDNAFVHISGLLEGEVITQDDRVEYEMGMGKKGPMAVEVRKIPK